MGMQFKHVKAERLSKDHMVVGKTFYSPVGLDGGARLSLIAGPLLQQPGHFYENHLSLVNLRTGVFIFRDVDPDVILEHMNSYRYIEVDLDATIKLPKSDHER